MDCDGIEPSNSLYGTTKLYALLMANFLAYYHSDAQSVRCQSVLWVEVEGVEPSSKLTYYINLLRALGLTRLMSGERSTTAFNLTRKSLP